MFSRKKLCTGHYCIPLPLTDEFRLCMMDVGPGLRAEHCSAAYRHQTATQRQGLGIRASVHSPALSVHTVKSIRRRERALFEDDCPSHCLLGWQHSPSAPAHWFLPPEMPQSPGAEPLPATPQPSQPYPTPPQSKGRQPKARSDTGWASASPFSPVLRHPAHTWCLQVSSSPRLRAMPAAIPTPVSQAQGKPRSVTARQEPPHLGAAAGADPMKKQHGAQPGQVSTPSFHSRNTLAECMGSRSGRRGKTLSKGVVI